MEGVWSFRNERLPIQFGRKAPAAFHLWTGTRRQEGTKAGRHGKHHVLVQLPHMIPQGNTSISTPADIKLLAIRLTAINCFASARDAIIYPPSARVSLQRVSRDTISPRGVDSAPDSSPPVGSDQVAHPSAPLIPQSATETHRRQSTRSSREKTSIHAGNGPVGTGMDGVTERWVTWLSCCVVVLSCMHAPHYPLRCAS